MFNEQQELADEFPEFREQIHQLKSQDAHFARLAEEYHKINRESRRIDEEIETVSDVYAETLKKKRLQLKDEIASYLKKGAA